MGKRIAFFMPSLRGGGAERVMLTLAGGMAGMGVSVDLVLAGANGPLVSQAPPNIQIVDLGQTRVSRSIPGLAAYLRKSRPAALLSAMGHANAAAILARRIAGTDTRLAISVHSTPGKVEGGNTVKRAVLKHLLRELHHSADVIIAVSKGVAEDYIEYMELRNRNVTVIYNPAVRPELYSKAEEPPGHEWLVRKNTPIVLAVGRLSRAKDYPSLIDAFRMVHAETGARLIILGEGEERNDLESRIREKGLTDSVSLPGFVGNPYAFMKRADVFVLSSKWEGFGLVLAEALSLGTPVVSTNCPGGPSEILENGRWGRLVPVGDVKRLALALIETIRNPVRDVAIERASAFTIDTVVREYINALHIDL